MNCSFIVSMSSSNLLKMLNSSLQPTSVIEQPLLMSSWLRLRTSKVSAFIFSTVGAIRSAGILMASVAIELVIKGNMPMVSIAPRPRKPTACTGL
ncbi:hypothetical protein DVJ83_16030 (plasmid) [Deinococcus wulumuqiensis]|uniref:Uncharacterized protein n=1 Tax=Deinococcus wulumuqiensis TaxID=980427 RepID=A0A345ILU0_9DEIO|nr:hypothetical protein DVJ83_16030 [Deinococcus wulumuqiensis]